MGEFFFVIKTLIITAGVVLLMQIKVGRNTIEQHSMVWLRDSAAVENLRYVAEGAIQAGTKGYEFLVSALAWKSGEAERETAPAAAEKSGSFWEMKRSDAYFQQQEKRKSQRSN